MGNVDSLYLAWSIRPTEEALAVLISAVRRMAYKAARGTVYEHREDFAQDVSITIWSLLPGFIPQSAGSFSHWLSSIIRRIRLNQMKAQMLIQLADDFTECAIEDDPVAFDTSILPVPIRQSASLLASGYTIKEAAEMQGLEADTLRQRFRRYRKNLK
ncbi:sigma-70 family RNA polymerase sigma factor [Granulicella cerasi]|uniref:Sigma-70 family RNA polymerase sigma factor n=1 Tax=Granulicella cerasi TaxID=741063 RepID=A0ABW1Z4U1_9BACT|nr:sigma-70 family RNA polymerase sigma factor [Granulicella cerasi]